MSTLKTNAILDASGGTTATVNGYTPTASNMAGRNRIINGDMRIDQRNAGASVNVVTGGPYFNDRWQGYASQSSKATVQQNAGSVTPPAGFTNYLGWAVGASASVTVGSADYFFIDQPIEGFNVADLAWGTASAATITVSFVVRSSLTGTFSGSVVNASANRSYPFSYTISSANTWETKSVTIAGDTTGTWATNNTIGLTLRFCLGSGSTRLGTASTWAAANYDGATGTTNLISTNSATFYVTGVQLEAGAVATDFEYRLYSTELALCQRYFQNGHVYCLAYSSTGSGFGDRAPFPTVMRATPSITYSNTVYLNASGITTNEVDIYGVSPQVATTTNGATRYISDFAAAAEL